MPIKPFALQRGDTIGIVTLGSPPERNEVETGVKMLEDMGFNTILSRNVYARDGFLAGTEQERAMDLMHMFANPQVKMILPSRGGVGVAGILPYLDYSFIQRNAKIISGYSDMTVLLNALYQFAHLTTFQSLMLVDFNPNTPNYNFNQFFSAVSSSTPIGQIQTPPDIPLKSRIPGNVTGPIVGGNLTSLIGTIGTPFEIDTRGKILLLEDTHEPINTIFRYIEQLRMSGKFRDCIGIIMGECTECDESYGKTYEDLINEFIVPLGKPLMTNLTTAHGTYKTAIPIGAMVNLNTFNNTLTVLSPTTTPSFY
ncbi:S66 peptidase family protein [Halobacillus karajensis]|uniref:Murein peptide carboxypeptidase n=1 Tax=Halobacillus karajensis TaxID=195088 RepID=A0A024P7E7_9BACI|nr:LD-carboxypeptidase [Halobacillus karajensis]CDQ20275.1 putative murein peptide carboxypeptidase [Halobacillus karajensis]CDQ25064.1 putative murein peptide carboxypeptidase [Halobacillus karajensis]CDQ28575.1 putative murein peptide carboxypeptidase [Halobacillus karajensis]